MSTVVGRDLMQRHSISNSIFQV